MTIETDRLWLRPPPLTDVPALFEFLGDPVAMQFTHCDATLRHADYIALPPDASTSLGGCPGNDE